MAMMNNGFNQFAQQQPMMQYPQQQYSMPPGYQPQRIPLNNGFEAYTGMSRNPISGQRFESFSTNPGFGPRTHSVPDNGAGRIPEYRRLQDFGERNGSLDGTFVTPHTSLQEDQANLNRLSALIERQSDGVLQGIRNAPLHERQAMREAEERVQHKIQRIEEERGHRLSGGDRLLLQTQSLDELYREGKVNPELGQRNAELKQMLNMEQRANANEFLKFGEKTPPDMARKWIAESPFNPRRENAHDAPAERPPHFHPRLLTA